MKTKFIFLFIKTVNMRLCMCLIFITIFSKFAKAQNAEEENVKQSINKSIELRNSTDADAWAATWVHDANASSTFIGNGFFDHRQGWESFGPDIMKQMKGAPDSNKYAFALDSFIVKVEGNMAWVNNKEIISITTPDNITRDYRFRQQRVLIKENNEWKIFALTHIRMQEFNPSTPQEVEDAINNLGYAVMTPKTVNTSIEVLKLNVKLFPKSWNVYDSLGEAYAMEGNKALAIANYKKSIELNPKNENGKKILEKLQAK